jgi:Cu+-exporting ATPase
MTDLITMPVEGMTCAGCVSRVERSLKAVAGVADASVNLITGRAEVRWDPASTSLQTQAPTSELVSAVERAGYAVPRQTVDLTVTGMTCAACVSRIEGALRRVPGVLDATVDLVGSRARATVLDGQVTPAALIRAVEQSGYEAAVTTGHASPASDSDSQHMAKSTRSRNLLILGVLCSIPLLLPMFTPLLGLDGALPGWGQLALATPVQLILGWPIYRSAFKALRAGTGNMDQLVAVGTTAAFGLSLWMMGQGHDHLYFEAAAVVITLVHLGRLLEARARRGTARATGALIALQPDRARVRRGGVETELPIDQVRVGDVVLVRPGERLPVDGVVATGSGSVDESHVTGEPMPVDKRAGDAVIAGAINLTGAIEIRTTSVGADSTLARIITAVERAQTSKMPLQRLVDQVAAVFVPAVFVIALLTVIGWRLAGADWEPAIINAVAVLVIACPCALGLATPTAVVVGTGVAARWGILIKDAAELERAGRIDVVAFDKTGTLTEGKPKVAAVWPSGELTEDELLRLAAAALHGSEHPLAAAVRNAATERGLAADPAQEMTNRPGEGVEARIGSDHLLVVGNLRLMNRHDLGETVNDGPLDERATSEAAQGNSLVWVGEISPAKRMLGVISLGDKLRATSGRAVRSLKSMGVIPAMLTGDNTRAAERVARELGIERYAAELRPEQKVGWVASTKQDGRLVAMVGDGINDAPALAAADLGIAMGGGTVIASESAGAVLLRDDPALVSLTLEIARATVRKLRENLFWAFLFNVAGLPLAAFGLLSPTLAGTAMALSSAAVVGNALRLYRLEPRDKS